jgi:hypothetical protein
MGKRANIQQTARETRIIRQQYTGVTKSDKVDDVLNAIKAIIVGIFILGIWGVICYAGTQAWPVVFIPVDVIWIGGLLALIISRKHNK